MLRTIGCWSAHARSRVSLYCYRMCSTTKKKRPAFNPRPRQPLTGDKVKTNAKTDVASFEKSQKTDDFGSNIRFLQPKPPSVPMTSRKSSGRLKPTPPSLPRAGTRSYKRKPSSGNKPTGLATSTAFVLFASLSGM